MGADGHIKIYDFNKLVDLVPQAEKFVIERHGHLYKRVIFEKTVVTMYWDSEYQEETCIICGVYGCDNNEHYEQVQEIDKKALIEKWEVWT